MPYSVRLAATHGAVGLFPFPRNSTAPRASRADLPPLFFHTGARGAPAPYPQAPPLRHWAARRNLCTRSETYCPFTPSIPIRTTEVTESNPPETDSKPTTPRGLLAAGRKLWDAATTEFDWADHELAILEEGCRTRDRIVQLDDAVKTDGLMLTSSQGSRVHPAVSEARAQRLTLARLLVSLGIPALEGDDLPASRGVRGVYGKGRR